jgi:hypothetical protein
LPTQDDIAECIKKDHVAVVGMSECFPIFSLTFGYINKQAERAGLRNIGGALMISGGAQTAQGGGSASSEIGQSALKEGTAT